MKQKRGKKSRLLALAFSLSTGLLPACATTRTELSEVKSEIGTIYTNYMPAFNTSATIEVPSSNPLFKEIKHVSVKVPQAYVTVLHCQHEQHIINHPNSYLIYERYENRDGQRVEIAYQEAFKVKKKKNGEELSRKLLEYRIVDVTDPEPKKLEEALN